MSGLRGLLICLCLALPAPLLAAPAITLFGAPKYAKGFTHFDYVNPDAPKGGELRLSTTAPFDSVNPYILKGVAAPGIAGFVYQTLMTPSYDEAQSYYPLIASDIAVRRDGREVVFTLNPRARWQDGKPITSADVLFSLSILKSQGHPSFRVVYRDVSASAEGPQRVIFRVAGTPQRELPLLLASLPVLPQHYFCPEQETVAAKADAPHCTPFARTSLMPPIGSGPYVVEAINPGRSITFRRAEHYWGRDLPSQRGLNNFDRIRYDVYRDDVVALEGIKSHQFDVYEEFIARNWATGYDVPAVRDGSLVKTLIPNKIPRGMQGFLFNTRLTKFADRRVREAIGLTLDFEWMNRVLFYGMYERNASFFNNTEFEAQGPADAEEQALWQTILPLRETPPAERAALLQQPAVRPPTSDGSGFNRAALIRAQTLLDDAGWVMRDGRRVNAQTGEPLTIEFLMTQRTFERVIGIMRHNLERLGIASSFRYIDASQYQKRLDHHQFDIVSIWWNLGTFYPGAEQFTYWHSSQAQTEGGLNLSGLADPRVDRLVSIIRDATTLSQLRPTARALDRLLRYEQVVIPHWNLSAWRLLYWNQVGRPAITPAYNLGIDTWWAKPATAAQKEPTP